MVMHKVDARLEAGEPPADGIIENMGQLIGRSLKEKIFLDGAGLHRGATRARVKLEGGGRRTVERGPYAEASNELVAGFAHVIATSIEHAIDLAADLGAAAGDRELEVGPVVEAWDLTGKPRPADAPYRFLLLRKADAAYEAGTRPLAPAARDLLAAWKRDGILMSEVSLAPSSTAARSRLRAGKRSWTDGPFTESKELVGGFSILEVPSLADAKRFADEYADILGDNEVDIRVVA
ncbi:MAG: hypothetical protein KF773_05035 [Deltaproteobacteria bacterium]|nr:hypothetical protein [Deltaproteobacteria bacterium]